MTLRNRLFNAGNTAQGDAKRVLTVCSAGLLRSPTMAWVLSNAPYNFNTRSCGASRSFALIVLDEVLIAWADTIVFMSPEAKLEADMYFDFKTADVSPEIIVLDVPDEYGTRDPALVSECEFLANKYFGPDAE